jgi:regulator of sigma D
MTTIIIIFLILIICVLSYLLYINYRRAEKLEQYCETYIQFISVVYFQFKETVQKMKDIDRLGAFQADDEVGTIFTEMNDLISNLYNFITKYVNTEETEEAEKTKN